MFKVNINNEIYEYNEEMTKQQITNEVNFKLPFYFTSPHIQNHNGIHQDMSNNEIEYKYFPRPILEPFVKFFIDSCVFKMKKKEKSDVYHHLHFRNFYLVKQGHVQFHIIHPKYADNFIVDGEVQNNKNINNFIKNNKDFITIELKKDSVLFVPNYWLVFIESKSDKTIIEKIQYKSILNELCFAYDKFKRKS